MGNCFGYNRKINDIENRHRREIDYLKSLQYEETIRLTNDIEEQKKEISKLNEKVYNLTNRCDQLLLDYYNLEHDYVKCKNELGRCKSRLGSFQNIFSL